MCGIAGAFSFAADSGPVDRQVIARLNEWQRRRGPDGVGLWASSDERVILGHRRLAIIETSAAGGQPMMDATGRWLITFNGEIYNYRELRSQLERQGRTFVTNSDTEVLINVVAEWGEDGLKKLRGMFAFALWDSLEQELWLVRDTYGIKPLYVAESKATIWFASQARALASCAPVNVTRSAPGLAGFYLWGYVPEPFTWWEGIRMFPPGHVQRLRAGQPARAPKPFMTVEALYLNSEPRELTAAELRESLLESVRYHFVADVPVGVLLSAGVDSNVIAALASSLGERLTAVTLAFKEYIGKAQDETGLARAMARQFGIPHVTATITREEFESLVDDFFDHMDQPTIDGLNMYLVSRAIAAQGFKVALCGLGGDELFAGYPSFRQITQILSLGWLFAPLRAVAQYVPVHFSTINRILRLSPKWGGVLSHSSNLAQLYILRRALHLEEELEVLLDKYWLDHGLHTILTSGMVVTLAQQLEKTALGRHAQIAVLESCAYMRSQLLRDADWASMSHSLEVRVPFVDAHLLRQLAPWIASAKPPTKHDLAGSMGQDMMNMLIDRGKTGFTTPVRDWAMVRSGNLARGLRGWSSEVHRRFRLISRDETAKFLTKQAA
jgi:asparagine synthase (glutamine-hydrolysing)